MIETKLLASMAALQHSQLSASDKFKLLREWFYVGVTQTDTRDAFAELVDDLEELLRGAKGLQRPPKDWKELKD